MDAQKADVLFLDCANSGRAMKHFHITAPELMSPARSELTLHPSHEYLPIKQRGHFQSRIHCQMNQATKYYKIAIQNINYLLTWSKFLPLESE